MAGESFSVLTFWIRGRFHLLFVCFPLSLLTDWGHRSRRSSDCSGWSKSSQFSKSDWELFLLKGRYNPAETKNVYSTRCCDSFPISCSCNIRWILAAEHLTDFKYLGCLGSFASNYVSVVCVFLHYGLFYVIFFCRVLRTESSLLRLQAY